MVRALFIFGTVLFMAGAPALAQSASSTRTAAAAQVLRPVTELGMAPLVYTSRALIEQDYYHGLDRLRKTAMKQKALDGGILTDESIFRLQARLDKLNMVREREIRRLQRS